MAAVDEFLEEIADDITASQKENAVLKSKMKVLVDKIEEYRANEEALNMAVLSAQKLAVQIEAEARQRAAAMIADAEQQVKETVGTIADKADAEEKRLQAAQAATAKFLENIRSLIGKQLDNIEAIAGGFVPAVEEKAEAPSVDDTVRSSESKVSRIQPAPSVQIDIDAAAPAEPVRQRKLDSTQTFSL